MDKKQIIVTSALPYANGEIHLGHIFSTYLPADIFTRFWKLKGADIIHICASDDFGTPILIKAENENKSPKDYVAYWNKRDLTDFNNLGIDFDLFDNTSSPENIKITQKFFKRLNDNNHLFTSIIKQNYCESCDKFLPDRYVLGTCPHCNSNEQYSDHCDACGRNIGPDSILNPICAICGSLPVKKESDHYFFKLSNFSEVLKKWLTENPNLQTTVTNYLLNWIKDGLKDWDITRDISWGVPIPSPGHESQVFYGWFDNHLCYISSVLKYFDGLNIDGEKRWNSSEIYHFIGKDIVYHHYLFLPAMRLGFGLDYKLPDSIPTRGHLLFSGHKLSKSKGHYISLENSLNTFNADYIRYYLSSVTPYDQSDVSFDLDDFIAKINNDLVANIGNFIHRTLSFISSKFDNEVPAIGVKNSDDLDFESKILSISKEVGDSLSKNEIDRALRLISAFSSHGNRYFQKKEPWADQDNSNTCLHLCFNAVRVLNILMFPFTPFSMSTLWDILNYSGNLENQFWDHSDLSSTSNNHMINLPEVLFKKLDTDNVPFYANELGLSK